MAPEYFGSTPCVPFLVLVSYTVLGDLVQMLVSSSEGSTAIHRRLKPVAQLYLLW
jgi:hypothetical protein